MQVTESHDLLSSNSLEQGEQGSSLSKLTGRIEENFEQVLAIVLAVIAAALAINDLAAGKYGADEMKLTNEKTSAYLWYQSKGIKESLVEGQRDLLKVLLNTQSIEPRRRPELMKLLTTLEEGALKYKKEKREILLGSKKVGRENWVQEVKGEMGQVIGAIELEEEIGRLDEAGEHFDLASLLLQLGLVLGTLGLVLKGRKIKLGFFAFTVALGVGGVFWSSFAFLGLN